MSNALRLQVCCHMAMQVRSHMAMQVCSRMAMQAATAAAGLCLYLLSGVLHVEKTDRRLPKSAYLESI